MKSRIVSRRGLLSDTVLIALVACLSGCTKSVTKYRADGTPYTEKEEDWVGTLAAEVLFLVVVGALAASKRARYNASSLNYDGHGQYPEGDEGKIQFVSMGSKRTLPICGAAEKVSVTDCRDKLLVTADASEHIEHRDLGTAESLLASAQISNLLKLTDL